MNMGHSLPRCTSIELGNHDAWRIQRSLYRRRHSFNRANACRGALFRELEYFDSRLPWNDKDMPFRLRHSVHNHDGCVVFVHSDGWDLAA